MAPVDSPSSDRRAALDAFKGRLIHQHGRVVEPLLEERIGLLLRQKAITPTDLTYLEDSARNLARVARDRRLAERNSRQASEAGSQVGGAEKRSSVGSRPDTADTATGRNRNGAGAVATGETPRDGGTGLGSGRATPRSASRQQERLGRARDQWDLIIRYDKRNYEAEESKKAVAKKGLTHSYRKELDAQMARVYEKRHELLRERERDKEAMMAEQQKVEQEMVKEEQERSRKVQVMKDAQARTQAEREKHELREVQRRKREREHLLEQVRREELEDAEREKQRKEQQRRGAKEIVESMKNQMDTITRRRQEEAREDKLMAEAYLREQDAKEREREAAVQARKDHLDMISKRMGTGLVADKQNREKADELSMLRAQAELEKKAVEEVERKKQTASLRISEMKDVLAKQIEDKQARKQFEQREAMEQGEIFARQAAQASLEDRELVQRRREQRRILDTYLSKQIQENRSRKDELEKAMPHLARREVEINQSIFREMQKDGFVPSETDKYLIH